MAAFATSYIPTTTAAATRAADVAVMTGANFSNWYNQAAGSVFVEGDCASPTQTSILIGFSDGTQGNRLRMGLTNIARLFGGIDVGGVNQANLITANATSANTVLKGAFAYASSDLAVTLNSGTIVSTSATSANINQVNIGGNGAQTQPLNGHIRRLAFFPRRLADAELTSITS
jgi:hypothetical protein